MRRLMLGLLLNGLMAGGVLAANVEVVEGQPDAVGLGTLSDPVDGAAPNSTSRVYTTPVNDATAFRADTQTELLLQLQTLQDEVRQLRGQVEEQSFLLDRLQKQSRQDYIDLDARLSGVSGTAPTSSSRVTNSPSAEAAQNTALSAAGVEAPTTGVSNQVAVVSEQTKSLDAEDSEVVATSTDNVIRTQTKVVGEDDEEGREAYKAAYTKVKERQFDQAKVAMIAFVGDHPNNKYVPNAHFWLGELYYHDSNLVESRDHFMVLVDTFPSHRKVPDAKFKLAKVHHQLGDARQAKLLLRSVVSDHPSSRVAKPAREYLENSL